MFGYESGGELLAIWRLAAGDYRCWDYRGCAQPVEVSQQLVFVLGHGFADLFNCDYSPAEVDESDDVAGNSSRECGKYGFGPLFQRGFPRKVK